MANTTLSPNMSLPIPVVGQDPGPDYGTDQNNAFTILDAHDHSAGSGVQITPSGLNINSDLTFGSNSITSLKKLSFTSQSAAITGTNFASCISGNLYFNDSSGNQIQITSGGGVAGTPGNIGGLASPAAATYSAGSTSFLWTAASTKAAAMDNGAVTIRETNVASAKGVTLASPSSLSADYQLTLPSGLPASTQYLTSNLSGVMSFSSADTIAAAMTSTGANAVGASMNSTGANAVGASMSATGANAVYASISVAANGVSNLVRNATTRSSGNPAVGGDIGRSSSSGVYVNATTTFTDVTNLSIQFQNYGRPVVIVLGPDGTTTGANITSTTQNAEVRFLRNGSEIARFLFNANSSTCTWQNLTYVDVGASAGLNTFSVQARVTSTPAQIRFEAFRVVGYEL